MTTRISYTTYRYITSTVLMLTALLFLITILYIHAVGQSQTVEAGYRQLEKDHRVITVENKALQAVALDSKQYINKGAPRIIQDTYAEFVIAKQRYEEACKKYSYAWC